MEKLIHMIEEELKNVESQGLTPANLETTYKLVDIEKDIYEIKEKKMELEEGGKMREYRNGGYSNYERDYGAYNGRGSYIGEYDNYNYGRRGVPDSRMYRGNDHRMKEHIERIMEGADEYDYGKQRYMHGDGEQRVHEGLEKMMYAVCMFIESTMDFAETPQEKEIIRKHIHKIKNI